MESAPLNLAHFHERRADRHLKRNRYDEAIKAMETALAYIEDAYKTISIPKAVQVLDAEKWSCSRKLKQISIRQSQQDGTKIHSMPSAPEPQYIESRQDDLPEIATMSIHQAIENFDAKYTSSAAESMYAGAECGPPAKNNNTQVEDSTNWMKELESKDFPVLAPLELPLFDLGFNNSSTFEDHDG